VIVLIREGRGGWEFTCDKCGEILGIYDVRIMGIYHARKAGWHWNQRKNMLLCPKHQRTRLPKYEAKLIRMGWMEDDGEE
jgi:hypothetical protein